MPDRCDICGITASENQRFAEEHLPFRRPKRYCAACYRKFYHRVYVILAVLPLVFGCMGIVEAYRRQIGLLDSAWVWCALLAIFQWMMVLPHELGHAAAAGAVGFTQLRILVGSGKQMFSFNLLGVPVLVNLVPFGGVTLFKYAGKPNRWKHFAAIAAGPLVNLTAVAVAWYFITPGALFARVGIVPKLFLAANLIVLAENLVPHVHQTPFGSLGSDGLQLWNILFSWNKPLSLEPSSVPPWKVITIQFFKWAAFLVTLAAAILFTLLAVVPFLAWYRDLGWELKTVWPPVMLALALLAGWIAVRIARHTVARVRKPMAPAGPFRQKPSWSPQQQQFLRQALERMARHDFAEAEAVLDQLIASLPDPNSANYAHALLMKLKCITSQNAIERAEKVCLDFISLAESTEQKLRILDVFVCRILYQPASPFLKNAERLARVALEIAPGTLTMKGSLGAVLAEQGNFAEAEPLLEECLDRSPALLDQGISSFYLGVVKLGTGNFEEAKRLINRATLLYPQPWLLAKAKARLKDLEGKSEPG